MRNINAKFVFFFTLTISEYHTRLFHIINFHLTDILLWNRVRLCWFMPEYSDWLGSKLDTDRCPACEHNPKLVFPSAHKTTMKTTTRKKKLCFICLCLHCDIYNFSFLVSVSNRVHQMCLNFFFVRPSLPSFSKSIGNSNGFFF